MSNVIDLRTSALAIDGKEPESNLISLLDVRTLDVSEHCRESLARCQGFMVLQNAQEIGDDIA